MTSLKCPYRSKHHVILLIILSRVYRPKTLHITQNKHGMLFTGTSIHTVPNSAYLLHFGNWFVVVCLVQGKPCQITTNHLWNVVNMQDRERWVFAKASCSTNTAWLHWTSHRAWSIWLYRLCRKKNTLCQSDRFAWTYSGRPSTVFHPSSRKTVEVCVQLTFQNGSHKKHGTDMQRLCCNIIRNRNLVHIIRTYTEHYHYAQTK